MPFTISIGRGPSNDIIVNQQTVSSSHAIITFSEDGNIIYTDNSTNGTTINNQFVRSRSIYIKENDIILLPGNILLSWNTINSRNPYINSKHQQEFQPSKQESEEKTFNQPTITEPEVKKRNICGLLSLIFALVAIPMYCPPITLLGEILSGVAFVLGFIGLFFKPKGKAIAGLVLSIIIPIIFAIIVFAILGSIGYFL